MAFTKNVLWVYKNNSMVLYCTIYFVLSLTCKPCFSMICKSMIDTEWLVIRFIGIHCQEHNLIGDMKKSDLCTFRQGSGAM